MEDAIVFLARNVFISVSFSIASYTKEMRNLFLQSNDILYLIHTWSNESKLLLVGLPDRQSLWKILSLKRIKQK